MSFSPGATASLVPRTSPWRGRIRGAVAALGRDRRRPELRELMGFEPATPFADIPAFRSLAGSCVLPEIEPVRE